MAESDFSKNLAETNAAEEQAQEEYDSVSQDMAVDKTTKEQDVKYTVKDDRTSLPTGRNKSPNGPADPPKPRYKDGAEIDHSEGMAPAKLTARAHSRRGLRSRTPHTLHTFRRLSGNPVATDEK